MARVRCLLLWMPKGQVIGQPHRRYRSKPQGRPMVSSGLPGSVSIACLASRERQLGEPSVAGVQDDLLFGI